MSRSALRRAVRRLTDEGWVTVRQGAGMYVGANAPMATAARTVSIMYPFEGASLTRAQDYLLERGCLLCVYSQSRTSWDVEAERRFLHMVKEERRRALLAFCSPLEPRNDDILAELVSAGVRVVHVGHYRAELPAEEYILPDYRKAGHMATVALMLAGYERIVFVGLNLRAPHSVLAEQGVAEALGEHGEGYDRARDLFALPSAFHAHPEAQARLVDLARRERSIGFVCETARLARLVADTLAGAGVRVPEEAGMLGPELVGAMEEDGRIDSLRFDNDAMLRDAMDAVLAPRGQPLRELRPPVWIRGGSVQKRTA